MAPFEEDQTSGIRTDEAAQEQVPVEADQASSGVKTDEEAKQERATRLIEIRQQTVRTETGGQAAQK